VFRLLGRYVFREILTSALLGTLLATFVIFLHGFDRLFDLLVQTSAASLGTVALLFALAVPPVLPMTIPFGVLVGILIGLGRMAADGEIVAMRANGVSSRRIVPPVLAFACLGMCLAGYASLRLTPMAMRMSTDIVNELARTELSAEIQPRVFDEDFPDVILYVGDVRGGERVLWHPVFLADVSPPGKKASGMKEEAVGPLVTVARQAIAVSDPQQRRMVLSMRDAYTYRMGKDGTANDGFAPLSTQALDAAPAKEQAQRASAMNTRALMAYKSGPDLTEDKIELHRRFAMPVACIMLALVGIPLGTATRKGGRSAGYVNAVVLAFFCYWLSSMALVSYAKQGKLPVPVAIWLPDAAFFVAGVLLIARMERPGDRDPLATMKNWLGTRAAALKPGAAGRSLNRLLSWRTPLLPQIVDAYILSQLLLYFVLLLASFIFLTEVFTFFDLTNDMIHNHIPLATMFRYLFFLTPELIYRTLPVSVLVAVLVTFGVLSKQNEVIAFKACGVSLYRLALPVFICGTALSTGLFAFDHYYVPGANRKQESLRAVIKGKPTQTYLAPERKWIMGQGSRIYYYRYFDPSQLVMAEVSVFELDPNTFRMVRQVSAERARWSPEVKQWVFYNGWASDFPSGGARTYEKFEVKNIQELTEPPDYFLKEQVQDKQMNFRELDAYIRDLKQSGFDTVNLQVQFYRKFSAPLFALIMALLAVPFAFMVGSRGAMAGVGVSIGIAIAYWGVSTVFEKMGGIGELDPAVAAWSPDVIFALAGLYLLLRVRS
jgi:LPS export ABC transporter permease LptG/LPS export ABC transporter permease LptF